MGNRFFRLNQRAFNNDPIGPYWSPLVPIGPFDFEFIESLLRNDSASLVVLGRVVENMKISNSSDWIFRTAVAHFAETIGDGLRHPAIVYLTNPSGLL